VHGVHGVLIQFSPTSHIAWIYKGEPTALDLDGSMIRRRSPDHHRLLPQAKGYIEGFEARTSA
jgi:hypothetical protein